MKKLTGSISTFEKMIRYDYLYMDKTEYIWKLVEVPLKMYFLSRPRRFGKSLTLSTLKAVFEGRRDLFKGLAIDAKPYDWKPCPVIHLDLNGLDFNGLEETRRNLRVLMQEQARGHGIAIPDDEPHLMFRSLIRKLNQDSSVVILLDEYDKPILNNLDSPCLKDVHAYLKTFYSVIKAFEDRLRLVFIAGVSRFRPASLFSDLNNLSDISLDARFAGMLGYTQTELEQCFAGHIERTAARRNLAPEELKRQMKEWYDGYRFHGEAESVYNPYSIARFFEMGGEFKDFWFEPGTAAYLIGLIREQDIDFERSLGQPVPESAFQTLGIDEINPLTLLLQTGYLTIRSARQDFGVTEFQLDFPNREVAEAFNTYLIHAYTGYQRPQAESFVMRLAKAVRSGEVDRFMESWRSFLAGIPYDIQLKREKHYQAIFFAVFKALGCFIQAEARTNNGRVDAVCSCGQWTYILEFKLNQTAETALRQIKDNDYFRRYAAPGRRIVLIGANFTYDDRQLSDWKYEELPADVNTN